MTLTEKQFEHYLMLYGTDLDQWPETLRMGALCAVSSDPAFDALIIRHQYFEEMLLANDVAEAPSPDFSDRILRAARSLGRKANISIMDWIAGLFSDFSLPQPAYVAAICMVLGLGLGLGNAEISSNPGALEQIALADEGAAL